MNWTTTTLGELTQNYDAARKPIKGSDRIFGSTPYYGASGVIDYVNGYTHDGIYLLVAEDGENLRTRNTPVAFLADGKFWANNHVHVLRAADRADAMFLSYLLAVTDISGYLTGTTLPKLNQRALSSMQVRIPSRQIRSAIVAVISALDDKIDSNEIIARIADDISELRFGAMTKEHLSPLSDLARFINGRAFTKGASGSGRVVIRIAELNSGLGGSTVYSDTEVADDHLARPGDLLFAWSGSLMVHRWYRPEAIINQHIFKVVPQGNYPIWLVHQALLAKLAEFKAVAAGKATTMGHIQRHHLDEVIAIPAQKTVAQTDALMSGLWRTALAAKVENMTLLELRDTLLPPLMSGRLRVEDAKRHIKDAV